MGITTASQQPELIVVSWLPWAGKTTLGLQLAMTLEGTFIDNDNREIATQAIIEVAKEDSMEWCILSELLIELDLLKREDIKDNLELLMWLIKKFTLNLDKISWKDMYIMMNVLRSIPKYKLWNQSFSFISLNNKLEDARRSIVNTRMNWDWRPVILSDWLATKAARKSALSIFKDRNIILINLLVEPEILLQEALRRIDGLYPEAVAERIFALATVKNEMQMTSTPKGEEWWWDILTIRRKDLQFVQRLMGTRFNDIDLALLKRIATN